MSHFLPVLALALLTGCLETRIRNAELVGCDEGETAGLEDGRLDALDCVWPDNSESPSPWPYLFKSKPWKRAYENEWRLCYPIAYDEAYDDARYTVECDTGI